MGLEKHRYKNSEHHPFSTQGTVRAVRNINSAKVIRGFRNSLVPLRKTTVRRTRESCVQIGAWPSTLLYPI